MVWRERKGKERQGRERREEEGRGEIREGNTGQKKATKLKGKALNFQRKLLDKVIENFTHFPE